MDAIYGGEDKDELGCSAESHWHNGDSRYESRSSIDLYSPTKIEFQSVIRHLDEKGDEDKLNLSLFLDIDPTLKKSNSLCSLDFLIIREATTKTDIGVVIFTRSIDDPRTRFNDNILNYHAEILAINLTKAWGGRCFGKAIMDAIARLCIADIARMAFHGPISNLVVEPTIEADTVSSGGVKMMRHLTQALAIEHEILCEKLAQHSLYDLKLGFGLADEEILGPIKVTQEQTELFTEMYLVEEWVKQPFVVYS